MNIPQLPLRNQVATLKKWPLNCKTKKIIDNTQCKDIEFCNPDFSLFLFFCFNTLIISHVRKQLEEKKERTPKSDKKSVNSADCQRRDVSPQRELKTYDRKLCAYAFSACRICSFASSILDIFLRMVSSCLSSVNGITNLRWKQN